MSTLTIVRHGQAMFFGDDYDRLSDVGQLQASLLGAYWARRGLEFDEIYVGPRIRQQRTAELAGCAFRQAGGRWPEPIMAPELDEYDIAGLVHRLAPEFARQDRAFAELLDQYRHSTEDHAKMRSFQKAFEMLTSHWVQAGDSLQGVETWPTFRDRVERCLRTIREKPGRGRRVALFSSGGFIGAALQLALRASDPLALELSWRIRNCAVSEFVFTQDRFTLDGFNAVPHLENAELWTYR